MQASSPAFPSRPRVGKQPSLGATCHLPTDKAWQGPECSGQIKTSPPPAPGGWFFPTAAAPALRPGVVSGGRRGQEGTGIARARDVDGIRPILHLGTEAQSLQNTLMSRQTLGSDPSSPSFRAHRLGEGGEAIGTDSQLLALSPATRCPPPQESAMPSSPGHQGAPFPSSDSLWPLAAHSSSVQATPTGPGALDGKPESFPLNFGQMRDRGGQCTGPHTALCIVESQKHLTS